MKEVSIVIILAIAFILSSDISIAVQSGSVINLDHRVLEILEDQEEVNVFVKLKIDKFSFDSVDSNGTADIILVGYC